MNGMSRPLKDVLSDKRKWHFEPSTEAKQSGFKGWYSRGYLPHFDAPGAWQFITYRLADSVPASLLDEWRAALKLEDEREKFRRIERFLDAGHGACHLRDARVAQIVQDNFWFHDHRSYRLLAWVLMPNHVHLLAELKRPLRVVLHKWKSYMGNEVNEILGRSGRPFWQADYFDRYVRDREHYRKVVRYIENNPVKAGLVQGAVEWSWSSARFRGNYGSDELPRIPAPPPERGQGCPRSD